MGCSDVQVVGAEKGGSAVNLSYLSVLGDDERPLVEKAAERLQWVSNPNEEAEKRYSGAWLSEQFGISIPPTMQNLKSVAGWCGTVVDVLEERLDWLGWMTSDGDDSLGLDEVYAKNELDVDSGMAHLDSLIFGVSFVVVGTGVEGEPSPLITPHSPRTLTGTWSRRLRRMTSAVSMEFESGTPIAATLYLPDETIQAEVSGSGWFVVDRDKHNLGRVPVVMVPNRVRGSRETGRSEITNAVRYYADAAARTLLGLEVNREFYNAPQRIGLNIPEDAYVDASGNAVSPWTAIQGRVWNVPPNDDGSQPDVKQFPAASPSPYIDQVKGYATLLAAEAGIPPTYLGFQTDNPASADAIRAGEARLVKRAERRQMSFGRAWREVGRLSLLVRDGAIPADFDSRVSVRWRDAATPTRAAAADEATKLIGSGVLPADSTVTYDRVGLSPAEQAKVVADKRRANAASRIADLVEVGRGLRAQGGDSGASDGVPAGESSLGGVGAA